MQKESVIENRYTIRQTDKTLTTKILKSDLDRINMRPQVKEVNFLNHWIDTAPYEGNSDEIIVSTQLQDDEATVDEYKSSISTIDLTNYRDAMIPVMTSVLEFAYYQEKSKQWQTPINPLNLIYCQDEVGKGHISAFYREPDVLHRIDANFLDEVVKIGVYLFIPNDILDSVEDYPNLTAEDYITKLDTSSDFKNSYSSEADEYIDFIYECFTPHNEQGEFNSVRDILENISAFDEIAEVDDPANNGAIAIPLGEDEPVNLNDYQAQPEQLIAKASANDIPQEDNSPKKSKKELKQEKLEAERKELEEKKKKKDAAKRAKKEQKKKQREQKNKDNATPNTRKENNKAPAKKKSNTSFKKPFIMLGVIAALVGGYYVYNNHQQQVVQEQKQKQQQEKQAQEKKTNPLDNSDFNNGIQYASANNFKKATECFNDYFSNGGSQSDLNDQQISSVFNSYLHTGDYQKILDNIGNKETAMSLVNYLSLNNQLNKVNDLYSSQPIIKFVKADNQQKYDEMVELSPNLTLNKNKKLQDDMCNAFAQTNKLEQGKEWADDESNPQDVKNAIKAHAYQLNKVPHDQIDKALS